MLNRRTFLSFLLGTSALIYFPVGAWADTYRTVRLPILSPRGLLYDADKRVLAGNCPNYQIVLVPQFINWTKLEDQLMHLRTIFPQFDKSVSWVKQKIGHTGFYRPLPLLEHLTWEAFSAFSLEEAKMDGIQTYIAHARFYPFGESLAPIVGELEKNFDKTLTGLEGHIHVEMNAQKKPIRILSQTPPVSGKDLVLTLQAPLQEKTYKELKGISGCCVIMEVRTGRLRVCIDPHRAMRQLYSLGEKTLMPIGALNALQEGVSPEEAFTAHTSHLKTPGASKLAHAFGLSQRFDLGVGQGAKGSTFQATPLQMATMAARLASGNLAVQPFLLFEAMPYNLALPPTIHITWWTALHKAMAQCALHHTHALWQVAGTLEERKRVSLFVGYAPVHQPHYSMSLVLEQTDEAILPFVWQIMGHVIENHENFA